MADTITKKQNIRSQIHIIKICIYGENERKYTENNLGDEINRFSLRRFFYKFEEKKYLFFYKVEEKSRLRFEGSSKS